MDLRLINSQWNQKLLVVGCNVLDVKTLRYKSMADDRASEEKAAEQFPVSTVSSHTTAIKLSFMRRYARPEKTSHLILAKSARTKYL